ncbi:MAG: DUF2157 domain-containing protein [Ilumatobacteraceae bacterium]
MIGLVPLLLVAIIVGVVYATTHHSGRHALLAHPRSGGASPGSTMVPSASPARHGQPQPSSALEAAVRQWTAAGLISAEQANAIEQYEAAATQALQPVSQAVPTPQRRVPLVAEALGYLGGTLGIVGLTLLVARYWPDMALGGRLALSGGSMALTAIGGYLVHEGVEPAFTRLRWFLWLVSSASGALFAGVLATDGFGAEAPSTIALACAGMIAAHNLAFWAGRQRPLQQALALVASAVAAGTLMAQFAGQAAVGGAVWIVGATLAFAGIRHLTSFPPLTTGIGAAAAIVGSTITAEPLHGAGFLILMSTVGVVIALASLRIEIGSTNDRLVLLVVGAVGAVQAVPGTIGYFAQQAGVLTGLVVWLLGALAVVAASRNVLRSSLTTEVVGGIAMVVGAAVTGVQSPAFATLFGIATAIGLIALGTVPGRVLLSLFGSVGLLVNVPWAIRHFFPGEGRVPLLILASGAVIIVVAVWLARLGGRFRSELRH